MRSFNVLVLISASALASPTPEPQIQQLLSSFLGGGAATPGAPAAGGAAAGGPLSGILTQLAPLLAGLGNTATGDAAANPAAAGRAADSSSNNPLKALEGLTAGLPVDVTGIPNSLIGGQPNGVNASTASTAPQSPDTSFATASKGKSA